MEIFLIIIHIFAVCISANNLLIERKYCKHLYWWSDVMAFITFLLCLIPGLGILLSMSVYCDCTRNIIKELKKEKQDVIDWNSTRSKKFIQ